MPSGPLPGREKKNLTITALKDSIINNQLDDKKRDYGSLTKKLLQPQFLSSLFKDSSRKVEVERETGLAS